MLISSTMEESFGQRSTREPWESMSREIQQFRGIVMKAKAIRLTGGVTDDKILSMSIANHLKKRSNISMDAKEYPHNRWSSHLAYKVLRTEYVQWYPKSSLKVQV